MTAHKATQFTVYVPYLCLSSVIYCGVAMFVPGSMHMRFVMEKVELEQGFFFLISLFLLCQYHSESVQ